MEGYQRHENLDKTLGEVPTPYNGVTYCQGLYQMDDHSCEAVTIFGDKIFLAHARDLRKLRYPHRFEEVSLGEGDIDIPKTLMLHDAIGRDGIMCPSISGRQELRGQDLQARAVGYLKKFVAT